MTTSSHFPYLPHTDAERKAMLAKIGVASYEELISHIPHEIRAKELALPSSMSELELTQYVASLAEKNIPASKQASFLGGGSYRRFVPQVVQAIASRSEFATAYTPYQPEASQGTLQAIYEFQTSVCLLTGMDVANASMYDGPTAAAEACLMAARITGRNKIVLAGAINPEYKMVAKTYCKSVGLELAEIAAESGQVLPDQIAHDQTTAAIVVQNPNYFGICEDLDAICKKVHGSGTLVIVLSCPISLGLLKTPGELGADIVVGDAQQCGNNLSFGGPSAGYLACRKEFVRQLPGRICGKTVDCNGKDAYTLTLQTREQHIRRAKATSNICTNQALNALCMLVYLCMMGQEGLKQVAEISLRRAHYLAENLSQLPSVKLAFDKPFFNEFVITTEIPAKIVLHYMKEAGILAGLDVSQDSPNLQNAILVAVTEMNSKAEMDAYKDCLAKLLKTYRGNSAILASQQPQNGLPAHK